MTSTRERKRPTGKSLGLAKGDLCINRYSGWASKIISDVHTFAPVCEVWGFEHEFGSVYADELVKCTQEQFDEAKRLAGF